MIGLAPLSDLIPAWPANAPQTGADLILVDDEEIDDLGLDADAANLVTELRRHLRAAALARGQSRQLGSAAAVTEALETGDLAVLRNRWVTYPLDRHRRRDFMAVSSDKSRTVTRRSVYVPSLSDLPDLPDGGAYLIVRSGDPGVLEIDDVRRRLEALADELRSRHAAGTSHPLADVVFHLRGRDGGAPTTWSLREQIGSRSNEPVPFPNPDLIKEMDLWNR
jgi:hypothetical protein